MALNQQRRGSSSGALLLLIPVALFFVAERSDAQSPSSARPLFSDDTPLSLRISGPFRALGNDPDERPEYDALIEHVDSDGTVTPLEIEFRIRGRSRLANCSYPPLSIDFPRDAVAGTVFAGQNRLKLVTLCRPASAYQDYLVHEFLIYRMLNELTNRSFRVRWATVEYISTDTRRPRSRIEPAFLIEEDWEVAERLGMQTIEVETIETQELDPQYAALISLAHFIIGNTDWSIIAGPPGESCCHNGKVVGRTGEPSIVLPYDFDNSGLVSASYAVPSDILPIRSVRERLYRGLCATNDQLSAALLHLNLRRERLIELFDDELLNERARQRGLDYLNESFEILNDPVEREEQIYGRCT